MFYFILFSWSFITEYWLYHVDYTEFVVLPHSVNYRIVLVENTIPVELILFEVSFVPLAVVKVLNSLAVEHAVLPDTLILFLAALPEQGAKPALHAILKLALIPAAICPPEGAPAIPFAGPELALIDIGLLARPPVQPSAFLLVKPEIPHIIVPSGKVQFTLALELTVGELTVDDLVSVLEKTHATAMGTIDLGLA